MRVVWRYTQWSIVVAFMLLACVDPYDPEVFEQDLGVLVVNAYINGTTNSARVELTRTRIVNASTPIPVVTGATVLIEREDGPTFSLDEITPGTYIVEGLSLVIGDVYRLRFSIGNNEYQSEYITLKDVPPIENVFWEADDEGVQIYLNTNGADDTSPYYRWTFEETWEYRPHYQAVLSLGNGAFTSIPQEERGTICWKTNYSGGAIANTQDLVSNEINRYELQFVPEGDIRLSRKYSLLAKQMTLSPEAYDYWLEIKKTNETQGGLFDPIPAQVNGNITCTTNSSEDVIGYFDGSFVQEKRIFIHEDELPGTYIPYGDKGCQLTTVVFSTPGVFTGSAQYVISTTTEPNGTTINGYTTSAYECVDCREKGGYNVQPDFWE